jgi:hypothetical protein
MDTIQILILIIIILLLLSKPIYRENYNSDEMSDDEKDIVVQENDEKMEVMYKNSKMSSLLNNNKKPPQFLMDFPKRYKIAFITFENRDERYVKLHNENIKKYCDKWGYNYIYIPKNETEYSPYWYKVILVNDILKTNKYDYVFWMDSDTIINNFIIDIGEDILDRYDSDILVASDNVPNDVMNAGLFVIRNSKTGNNFMEDWVNSYKKYCIKNNKSLRGKWSMSCYEQGNMNKLIFEKYSNNTTFINRNIFQNFGQCQNDVFVMHYYGRDKNIRAQCFEKAPHH